MTWFEVDALDRDRCLVFLAVSPLEQHGPHLPLGMDFYGAEWMMNQMAERFHGLHPNWEVLLTPPMPIGSNAFDFPGSMFTRQRVVRDLLVDYCASLARHGFKNVVLVSVHGGTGHIVALEEACDIVSRRCKANMISPIGVIATKLFSGAYIKELDSVLPQPLTSKEREFLCMDWHAGWFETSLMLLVRPDLVKDSYKELDPILVDDFRKVNDQCVRTVGRMQGYLGAPALATKEFAQALTGLFVRDAVTMIEKMVLHGKEAVAAEARSMLYEIPFLRTDFVRNSVAVGAGLLLTLLGGIPLMEAVIRNSTRPTPAAPPGPSAAIPPP